MPAKSGKVKKQGVTFDDSTIIDKPDKNPAKSSFVRRQSALNINPNQLQLLQNMNGN
jgi:hypothetical protein